MAVDLRLDAAEPLERNEDRLDLHLREKRKE